MDNNLEPIIICGCGTTIWGIKINGEDGFWFVLGDEINTLELCDIDDDGRNEVIKTFNFFYQIYYQKESFLINY